jgi:hypothetical protein
MRNEFLWGIIFAGMFLAITGCIINLAIFLGDI